jgi:Retroviral aspartyl protease
LKQRTGSRSISPSLLIEHVQVAQIEKNTMTVDILISNKSLGQKKSIETTTLLDTGAGGKFIDQNFIQNQKIKTKELKYPIKVLNVNGTLNKQGTITKYTRLDLTINGQTRTHNLLVTKLGKQKIYLDIRGSNRPTQISTGRNAHLLGEQNRTKGNSYPNQQSKMRLI